MKKWLPWALLAISGAFNVFFAVGAFLAHARRERFRSPEFRAKFLADELGMDEKQRAAYLELCKRLDEEKEKAFYARATEERKLWEELAKDEPDEDKLKGLILTFHREHAEFFLEHARALAGILRPEQRKRLAEVMGRCRPPPPPR